MVLDLNQSIANSYDVDICIIGSGAAGISAGLTLLDSSLKVLIIEGGGTLYSKDAADIHRAKITGHNHDGIHNARERIIGGTTTKWGGQALPFLKEDFEQRIHVPLSGWPISLEELIPFYKKAEDVLGLDTSVKYSFNPWAEWNISVPKLKDNDISLIVTKWCKVPNLSFQHISKFDKSLNLNLLANANVIDIELDSSNRVEYLIVKSLINPEKVKVKTKYVIAAGGAIETVRLFLSTKILEKTNIDNLNKHLGLYFQDHVGCIVGQIEPISKTNFKDIFDSFYKRGFKYFPRIKLNPKFCSQNRILHASGQIVYSEDNNDLLSNMKAFFAKVKNKEVPNSSIFSAIFKLKNIIYLYKILVRWKILKRGVSPFNKPIWLEIHSEQNPDIGNNITLCDDLDSLGMRRVKLNWTISDLTKLTIKKAALEIKKNLEDSRIANVRLEPWLMNDNFNDKYFYDVYHQSGGLRMSKNQEYGIVDSDCKVFGVDNLFVASSAVFPTSSFSNPTLTTMALAIRIAENLKQQLNNHT